MILTHPHTLTKHADVKNTRCYDKTMFCAMIDKLCMYYQISVNKVVAMAVKKLFKVASNYIFLQPLHTLIDNNLHWAL